MNPGAEIATRRDLPLFMILLGLAFLGLFFLYPASSVTAARETGDGAALFLTQVSRFVPGLLLMMLVAIIPPARLRAAAPMILLVNLGLLLLVFVPGIGRGVQSASSQSFQRWIALGPVQFQPSEFAKVALVLFVARVLSNSGPGLDLARLRLPGLAVGSLLFLILIEPQFGTTLSLAGVLLGMLVLAGLSLRYLFTAGLLLLPTALLLAYVAPYRWSRLRVWLEPYQYRHDGGYQLVTSFRAFADGGFFGEELAQGFAHRYLTYGHTDFILALIGENFGFLGVAVLVLLYALLLWRGVFLLRRTADRFGFFLGSGAVLMLISQAILNMFVVTGLLPTTGVSLPFVSFGGSSLVASLLLGGLLLNATRSAGQPSAIRLTGRVQSDDFGY